MQTREPFKTPMTLGERLATTARRLRQHASETTDAERAPLLRRGEECDERMRGYLRSSDLQSPN